MQKCVTRLTTVLLFSTGASAAQTITVDGQLDEPEWAQAQIFNDFRITEPFTRATPSHTTEVRVLPLADALYVGLRAEQAPDQRTHGRSPRDAPILDADPAILVVDFEGLGKTAYEFTISLSGTQRDSIILNQTDISRDWDADWIAATHEDASGWSAEWRIPWSVAPEGAVHGNQRTIGIYAGRYLKRDSVRYAFPAIEWLGANFVRNFKRIEVPRYSNASLDLYPYVSAAHDRLTGATKGRAGADVFWKPNGRNQVSLAINPDFGQVESDKLVVNFSAIETFFEEKRPFFTQGQQLFDLRADKLLGTDQQDRLVNTRRIGAAPDVGNELNSDVLAAAKYTGIRGDNEYGVFAAAERASQLAQGRQFVAGRWRHVHDNLSLGYLGTATVHPTLHRNAYVHALDINWQLGTGIALEAQALISDIHARESNLTAAAGARGYGAWSRLSYQPGGRWEHRLQATWFDRRLNFNDLGYQQRNNLAELQSQSQWYTRHYRTGSWADSGNWNLLLDFPYSASGNRLVATSELGHFFQWRNGGNSYFYYLHYWSGFDDLLSRGNGNVRLPTRHSWGMEYESPITGRFRYYARVAFDEQDIHSYTRQVQLKPKWFFTENLSLDLDLQYAVSPNWSLWFAGRQLGVYRREELDSSLNLNWYPAPKQELRLKMQWVGLDARARQLYAILANGDPVPAVGRPNDFTVSTVGLQLRYRYEFAPLSDLYVVYSRGGDGSLSDRRESLRDQFSRSLDQINGSLLFVKLRYRI